MKVVIKGLQNKEKEQGDAQTHDSDNIEFFPHIFPQISTYFIYRIKR